VIPVGRGDQRLCIYWLSQQRRGLHHFGELQRLPDVSGSKGFFVLWFSGGRGWLPAGMGSQKIGTVTDDIARFTRPYRFKPKKDP
jgi:hypothetical protein